MRHVYDTYTRGRVVQRTVPAAGFALDTGYAALKVNDAVHALTWLALGEVSFFESATSRHKPSLTHIRLENQVQGGLLSVSRRGVAGQISPYDS